MNTTDRTSTTPADAAAHTADALAGSGWNGKRVRVADRARWTGDRGGVVTGGARRDALPTGAVFVPVRFDDGATHNVDSRVLEIVGVAHTLTADPTVVATISRTSGDWSSTRQVPTFSVPTAVHGLVSLAHAADVAADIVTTGAPDGARAVLALSTPDATHVATYVVTDGRPVLAR